MRDTGNEERVDEVDTLVDGERRLGLQAVAGAHLADGDAVGKAFMRPR